MAGAPAILAVGEVLWDLLPERTVLGGAPLNLAYRVHTLGGRATIVSRVGRDALGARALAAVAALGLDTRFIAVDDERPTGTVPVRIDASGQPDFQLTPDVAYDAIAMAPELRDLARDTSCLCFGTVAQRAAQSRLTLRTVMDCAPQARRFCDLNLRRDCYTRETVAASLDAAHILKLNASELDALGAIFSLPGHTVRELGRALARRWPLQALFVTLGPAGAWALGSDGGEAYDPGYEVTVVDTVGSGDAFAAAALLALLRGETLRAACQAGNRLGALVATQAGATTPLAPEDWRRLDGAGRHSQTDVSV